MTSTRVDTAPERVGCATRVRRFCVQCSYDGTAFRGFAENADVRTVAGELRGALEKLFQQELTLTCSGRTDAGVHAWSQYVTFDVIEDESRRIMDADRVQQSLSRLLARDIGITNVSTVPITFDARFSASWRAYRYVLDQSVTTNPFIDQYSWQLGQKLDHAAMCEGAAALIGEHDFSSLCRKVKSNPEASLIRRLIEIDVRTRPLLERHGASIVTVDVVASAFCHQMVRSIVGLLVDIGLGRRQPNSVANMLLAKNRNAAGGVAPAKGLHLVAVGFDRTYPYSNDPFVPTQPPFRWGDLWT